MPLNAEKAADLAQILDAVGETVAWNGQSFHALVSDPAIGEELNLGGFTGTGEFTIKIMRAAFGAQLPKLGDIVGFEENHFRISRVTNHPQYPMLVLVVGSLE